MTERPAVKYETSGIIKALHSPGPQLISQPVSDLLVGGLRCRLDSTINGFASGVGGGMVVRRGKYAEVCGKPGTTVIVDAKS